VKVLHAPKGPLSGSDVKLNKIAPGVSSIQNCILTENRVLWNACLWSLGDLASIGDS
jgi:hypothetical protein